MNTLSLRIRDCTYSRPTGRTVAHRSGRSGVQRWGAGCLFATFLLVIAAPLTADDYWQTREQLHRTCAEELEALAVRCVELQLPMQAELTRGWQVPRDARRQILFLPPEEDPVRPDQAAAQIVHQWYARFREIRHQYAEALFQLARTELDSDHPARAYQLVHQVLREDPDHAAARQVLGYRRVNDRWRIPEGVVRSRVMRVASPQLGFAAGRYWLIESSNFSITTDHSEQAGLQLAERLERLTSIWQQVFFRFWSSGAALERRFDGDARIVRRTNRYRVVLFRDRDAYVQHLRTIEPRIEVTVGYYVEPKETAYFYAEGREDHDVVYHEVTHQLFSEMGRQVPGVGTRGNAGLIEGVAMYMESLRDHEGYFTLGGIDAERLQYARYRALNDQFYVPLAELVAMDRETLQQHPDIRALYSQSAGIAAMLMDYDRGIHREAFVEFLAAVYQGRDGPESLATVTDTSYAELDRRYRRFLDVTDQDLSALRAFPGARELSLGQTSITDAGLQSLDAHAQLRWLDLSGTAVTDAGFQSIPAVCPLQQLGLADTAVTDASLERVGGYRQLEILNLSGTAITDAGLVHLRGLAQLQQLSLAGTAITDGGLEPLTGLKRLAVLDWTRSGITPDGLRRLQQAIPGLNQ